MGVALRFLLLLIIAWYIYRVLDRLLGPMLFGKPDNKKSKAGNKGKEFKKSTQQGDVIITDYSKSSKGVGSQEDDFVDFEEVE